MNDRPNTNGGGANTSRLPSPPRSQPQRNAARAARQDPAMDWPGEHQPDSPAPYPMGSLDHGEDHTLNGDHAFDPYRARQTRF